MWGYLTKTKYKNNDNNQSFSKIKQVFANIRWIMEKTREFQKTSISALLTMPKPLTVQETAENSERDGNTRPPDLPL